MTDPDIQPTLDGTPDSDEQTPQPAERKVPDGHVVVRLATDIGEADIVVPPRSQWRSTARNRISQGDDLGWAAGTLSDEDIKTWIELDPVTADVEDFFDRFSKLSPEENRSARRAKRHLRAAS